MKKDRDSGFGIRDSFCVGYLRESFCFGCLRESFCFGCLVVVAIVVALGHHAAAQTNYQIGPQDVLTITVFGETDLSGKFTVEQDGTFTFPLIGRVKAGGASLRDVEQDLKKRLSDGYLRNPQVTVTMETYRSQRILIMGEVRSPAEYQLTGDMTLLSALARAGGPTPAAGREALIVRTPRRPVLDENGRPASEPEIIHVDLTDLQAGNVSLNIPLIDGDTITVPKAQSVFVSGQVKSPGAFPVEPETTVLQVLSLAGGLTERGAAGRIRIQRTVDGKKVEIKAKLTDTVLPGDTIIVPEKFF
jgi:polysaccharide export outer membrane protein